MQESAAAYEMSFDAGRVQLDVVHGFLASSYWSPGIRRDIVERAIANSVVIGAYYKPTGVQVGFARVVSDKATFAYLCDVFVVPEHRGCGLATEMIRLLHALPEFGTVRRWMLVTRDAQKVYEPLGYEALPQGRAMSWKAPESRWQA